MVGLSLGLQLGNLAAKRLGGLGVLDRIRHLLLKGGDLLVALCDGLLPVHTVHLRLVFLRLLLPEVFLGLRLFLRLCAMCITCHVGLPFSSAGSAMQPASDSYGYRLSMRHKVKNRVKAYEGAGT